LSTSDIYIIKILYSSLLMCLKMLGTKAVFEFPCSMCCAGEF